MYRSIHTAESCMTTKRDVLIHVAGEVRLAANRLGVDLCRRVPVADPSHVPEDLA